MLPWNRFAGKQLPIEYIRDGKADKDQIARAHAARLGIREGNVCALTCLELTPTFQHEKTTMAIRYRPTLMILSLSDRSGDGLDECADSDVVFRSTFTCA